MYSSVDIALPLAAGVVVFVFVVFLIGVLIVLVWSIHAQVRAPIRPPLTALQGLRLATRSPAAAAGAGPTEGTAPACSTSNVFDRLSLCFCS